MRRRFGTVSAGRHPVRIPERICGALINRLPEKYAVIGFDRAGNPLEIMYNPLCEIAPKLYFKIGGFER
jgi:hypothetical protein